MYNIRILIQEIQLVRGSFRIYVLIAHGSAPLGTASRTRQLGWWEAEHQGHCGWGTQDFVQFLLFL